MKKPSILCIRCDHIGDLLVSTPVFSRLRRLYPEAEINVITSPAGRLALVGNLDLDGVFVYNKKSFRSWLGLLPLLLKKHFHHQITPEIRRELFSTANRGENAGMDMESL